jgi:Cu+-exporting ATPase
MAEILLPVEGMQCVSCVGRVTKALQALSGVRTVDVDLEQGQARLDYDEAVVQPASFAEAIRGAGFTTRPISTLNMQAAPLAESPAATPSSTATTAARTSDAAEQVRLEVTGMHCASCVARVEKALRQVPGVVTAHVHLGMSQATVQFDAERTSSVQLAEAVQAAGYRARPAPTWQEQEAHQDNESTFWRMRLIIAAAILPFLILIHWVTPLPERGNAWLLFVCATPLQIVVGGPFFAGAWTRLRHGAVSMDTLVALGTGVAYAAGVGGLVTQSHTMGFVDAGMILTFITLGKYLESKAKSRASLAIRRLLDLSPQQATVLRDGRHQRVLVGDVGVGERILVRPGERIPLDAEILQGQSDIDESWLTGESVPAARQPGDSIYSGTINGQAALTAKVTRDASHTALAQIIELVRRAQESKAGVQRVADRLVTWFVPAVLFVAVVTFLLWASAGDPAMALSCMVAVLVVACPCALGLATPTAIMVGSGRGAELGILIKDAHTLETAGQITTVVLDKTGTITAGRPEVVAVEPAEGVSESKLITWTLAAERLSTHPQARAIIEYARERVSDPAKPADLVVRPGQGIEAVCEGRSVLVGNEALLQQHDVEIPDDLRQRVEARRSFGQTALWVAVNQELLGLIYTADVERPTSAAAVNALRHLGVRLIMLSGDHRETAETIAARVGISEVCAQLRPSEKHDAINQLRESGERVAMVGDGINDAPALVAADVGVAIGSGADVAIEAADIVLTRNDLGAVPQAIALSRATLRTIRQNLVWALAYNVVLLPLAAGIAMPLWSVRVPPVLAAAAMAASSVSVVTNSILLRHKRLG